MSQIDLIIFTSIVLLITFSLGWLAHVLVEKLYYKSERKQTNDQRRQKALRQGERPDRVGGEIHLQTLVRFPEIVHHAGSPWSARW